MDYHGYGQTYECKQFGIKIAMPKVAVLLPCFNEAKAIGQVVDSFRAILPEADVYVYDNNSNDNTSQIAKAHGAIVRHEYRQGKGHVVRRMFADVDADLYVLADGDLTYHAPSVRKMIEVLVDERLDMVVGVRKSQEGETTYRTGHQFGNKLFNVIVGALFEQRFTDILSGYRVMSRRFVKSFPALAKGFEIETQLTVHALELSLPTAEMETPYFSRPEGASSKLRTYRDGTRILMTILLLFKEAKPFKFFFSLAIIVAGLSLGFGVPVVVEYAKTGLVPRFPTAILATGLGLIGVILFTAGIILDSVSRGNRELRRLHYLSLKNVSNAAPD